MTVNLFMLQPALAGILEDAVEDQEGRPNLSDVSTEHNIDFYNPNVECGPGSGPGSSELDGYELPATTGGTGLEESINSSGQIPSGGRVTFAQHAALGKEYQDYYITMRWNYTKWNWNGTNAGVDNDQFNWMSEKPRLVHVTNPDSGKSIVAVALEAGPAPWTGVDRGNNNNPKQGWTNPQEGTPAGYKGRVSGFPPAATEALGMDPGGSDQRMYDGSGPELLYAWAADQDATPGPASTDVEGNAGQAGCGGGDGMSAVIYNGRALPVDARKKEDTNHWSGTLNSLPCQNPNGCHHTNWSGPNAAAAFDLATPSPDGSKFEGRPSPIGSAIYAIVEGEVQNVNNRRNGNNDCNQFWIVQHIDGQVTPQSEAYWYGHLGENPSMKNGDTFAVGEWVGEIGHNGCADDSYPHLHIDLARQRGGASYGVSGRDSMIVEIMNELYERLPG